MSRRVEIQPASKGLAVVEVWVVAETISRASMTVPMPREAARRHAHSLGCDEVIDHTQHQVDDSRARATRAMDRGEWRP